MASSPPGKKFIISEIASRQNIPQTFLRKIFQGLARSGIIDSKRGVGGGFYLLKRPSKISIKEILEIVQGPVSLSECLFDEKVCGISPSCRIRKRLNTIQQKLEYLLNRTPLSELL